VPAARSARGTPRPPSATDRAPRARSGAGARAWAPGAATRARSSCAALRRSELRLQRGELVPRLGEHHGAIGVGEGAPVQEVPAQAGDEALVEPQPGLARAREPRQLEPCLELPRLWIEGRADPKRLRHGQVERL